MKCLITGASGFLGKWVLQLLVDDPKIDVVHAVSRKKVTHPHPKVRVHQADLTSPWNFMSEIGPIDSVIHLAGLYQFNQPLHLNYQSNVLATVHLMDTFTGLEKSQRPQIYFASTYAVGLGSPGALQEKPLDRIPPVTEGYSHTKALAERALTDSPLSTRVFRLGVLVGDSQQGAFEKSDGPYFVMKALGQFKASRISRLSRKFPIPIPLQKKGIMPLVPVDKAAEVFHRALFLKPLAPKKSEFYGVFHSKSIELEALTRNIFDHCAPRCKPIFLPPKIHPSLLKAQSYFTGIPQEIFDYVLRPISLENPRFEATFGPGSIPHFNDFREAFFRGGKGLHS